MIGSFTAGPQATYRVGVAPCTGADCPIRVELGEAAVELGFPAREPTKVAKKKRTRGEPLSRAEADWFSTSNDEEKGSPDVLVQSARLGKGQRALVITLEAGFEHVHRLHEAIAGPPLAKVWSAGEGAGGPRWSAVEVADVDKDGIDEILHFDTFDYAGVSDAEPDSWTLTVFAWDAVKRKFSASKKAVPLYAAVVASEASPEKARAAKDVLSPNGGYCLSAFMALRSDDYPRLEKGFFVLAALSTKKSLAQQALAHANKCDGDIKGYVKRAR